MDQLKKAGSKCILSLFVASLGVLTPVSCTYTNFRHITELYPILFKDMMFELGDSYSFVPADTVDLGLSVCWSSANLGAKRPCESGQYYEWMDSRLWHRNQFWRDRVFANGGLDDDTDLAHVKFGGDWRMPDESEWSELEEKCTWTWVDHEDSTGFLITSNVPGFQGNSIFLPASGKKGKKDSRFSYFLTAFEFGEEWELNDFGNKPVSKGKIGYYWSSSLDGEDAVSMVMDARGKSLRPTDRYNVFTIRPCKSKTARHDCRRSEKASVDLGLSVRWGDCNLSPDGEPGAIRYYRPVPYLLDQRYWNSVYFLMTPAAEEALDIAHVMLGGGWRTPSEDEWLELLRNCKWTWTERGGVKGYDVVSCVPGFEGERIFLPANGYTKSEFKRKAIGKGEDGFYCSTGKCLYFNDLGMSLCQFGMYDCFSLRPVEAKPQ